MKTTIYDLLGMIKDGKAPKKIMYDGEIWTYNKNDYINENNWDLFDEYVITDILTDEVEILETTNKPDKIERIDNSYYHLPQDEQNQLFKNKINEIIDRLNKE